MLRFREASRCFGHQRLSAELAGSLRGLRSFRRNFSFDPSVVVHELTESLQAVHTFTGLPWWTLIPITTFGLRSVWTFPLAVLQRLRIQKQNELRPIVAATGPVLRLNLARKALKAAASEPKSEKIVQRPWRTALQELISTRRPNPSLGLYVSYLP